MCKRFSDKNEWRLESLPNGWAKWACTGSGRMRDAKLSSLDEIRTPLDHVSDGGMDGDRVVASNKLVCSCGTDSKYVDVIGRVGVLLPVVTVKMLPANSSICGVDCCSVFLDGDRFAVSWDSATILSELLVLGTIRERLRSGTWRLKLGKIFWT